MEIIEKLVIVFITMGVTRITIRSQEIIDRKKEEIQKKIDYLNDPPLTPALIKGTPECNSFLAKRETKKQLGSHLKIPKLISKKRSLARIAYWEILLWIIVIFGSLSNV